MELNARTSRQALRRYGVHADFEHLVSPQASGTHF
jgi:hypothetical protein